MQTIDLSYERCTHRRLTIKLMESFTVNLPINPGEGAWFPDSALEHLNINEDDDDALVDVFTFQGIKSGVEYVTFEYRHVWETDSKIIHVLIVTIE